MHSSHNLIEAENISKSYGGRPVLSGVSFCASAYESVVIVGRNGAGKSTLLSILAGYLRPDTGSVSLEGNKAAFCPQEDNLFDELTVADNILFWTRASGGGGSDDSDASGLFRLFEVDKYSGKKVRHLSGGMKKCVALICALSMGANVIILDEPFTGLDIFYKDVLLSAFEKLRDAGKCIIYTSHSMDEIMGLRSKVYTLSGGILTPIDTDKLEKDSGYELLRRSLLQSSDSQS